MIYELRIYEATPGRLGDLHSRFTDITLGIWDRMGIRPIGFWTTVVGPSNNALYYILEWTDLGEREEKWSRFIADEEWITRKAETESNGVLVARAENSLLSPTPYAVLSFGKGFARKPDDPRVLG